jgi:hypothetical protein
MLKTDGDRRLALVSVVEMVLVSVVEMVLVSVVEMALAL